MANPILRLRLLCIFLLAASASPSQAGPLSAQLSGGITLDHSRALQLYVSDRPEDHDPFRDHDRDVRRKALTDSIYAAQAEGAYRFTKATYPSAVGDLDIPAYLFEPLDAAGTGAHAALIWVHGGVHGDWSVGFLPFVKEAVSRGYVVIAPDYRGSTGYGRAFHDAIDYGGYEIDDVISAYDFLIDQVPTVDPARVAIMGWSHGGFIAAHSVFREEHPFRAAVAVVPVSNLILRLSYKGPGYQALFSTQQRIRGLPHEKTAIYRERSPIYHVDNLRVPMLVQVATNDGDVEFIESELFINALRAKKPELAETYIYVDPPGGHSFCCLVDESLQPLQTPEMRQAWEQTWAFLERHLTD